MTVAAGADSDAGGSTCITTAPTLTVDAFGARTGDGHDPIDNTGAIRRRDGQPRPGQRVGN